MRASFLHPYGETFASYRYRALIPAQQIGASINNEEAEILVISKPFDCLESIEGWRRAGKKLVVDFCDDHFNHRTLGPLYHQLAAAADYCVCPTEEMRNRIPYKEVAVIPDPYEFPETPPHAEGDKLLWFGHISNLPAMELYMGAPNLTIVTGPNATGNMIEYSPLRLMEQMQIANIALFPTMKGHEYKSPNRVVNAIRMGLFPVCDAHPAYAEFKRFLWASDVRTGLRWAGEFKADLNDLVKAGQDYVRDRYSPETIGKQWKDLLVSL